MVPTRSIQLFVSSMSAALAFSGARPAHADALAFQNGFESSDTCAWTAAEPPASCDATMVFVPAGEFTMGSNAGFDDQKPVHLVTLSAFWIDRTEVTTTAYAACVTAGGCTAPNKDSTYSTHCNYGGVGYGEHPVNCIDWYKAETYCAWMGKRLPTEAEWEKAARATNARTFPWGEAIATCGLAVMYDTNAGGYACGLAHTSAVGSRPAGQSPYGALDLSGNVFEWVNDWYDPAYYSVSPATDPQGPGPQLYKARRGGALGSIYPEYLRTAFRDDYDPTNWSVDMGFRCAGD